MNSINQTTPPIKVDPTFKSLIPPQSQDEHLLLEAMIVAEGCREPLVLWNGTLVDGHNRLEICQRLSIPFTTRDVDFLSVSEARVWICQNQLSRRNLSDAWKLELALLVKSDLLEIGRAKQGAAGGDKVSPSARAVLSNNDISAPAHSTQRTIAATAGVSTGKVAQAEYVRAKAPELWEKAKAGDATVGGAYTQAKREERQKDREQSLAFATASSALRPTAEVADAFEWLARQEPADLIITDPPYSTDIEDMGKFVEWLPLALSKMKPTGRAYVFVGAYPEELSDYLNTVMPDQVLVWTYRNTLGPTPKNNYKQNWQAILYFVGKDAAPLDCPLMLEQFSVQDVSAPDGRQGDRYHAWQKPLELADRLIKHSTKPGDTIIDPFCCTGTFLLSAAALGRKAAGCDISPENLKIAAERGCYVA